MYYLHLAYGVLPLAIPCHCEPVCTLAWQSATPDVRRNSLHSVSAVTVSAAETAYPLLPSSSPNQSKSFDLEKENRGNGYGAGGPKPGCGMERARLDADCHTSDVGHLLRKHPCRSSIPPQMKPYRCRLNFKRQSLILIITAKIDVNVGLQLVSQTDLRYSQLRHHLSSHIRQKDVQ